MNAEKIAKLLTFVSGKSFQAVDSKNLTVADDAVTKTIPGLKGPVKASTIISLADIDQVKIERQVLARLKKDPPSIAGLIGEREAHVLFNAVKAVASLKDSSLTTTQRKVPALKKAFDASVAEADQKLELAIKAAGLDKLLDQKSVAEFRAHLINPEAEKPAMKKSKPLQAFDAASNDTSSNSSEADSDPNPWRGLTGGSVLENTGFQGHGRTGNDWGENPTH